MSTNSTSWRKGLSGNPKGRPKAAFAFSARCRASTPELFKFLLDLALTGKMPCEPIQTSAGGVIDLPPFASAEVRVKAAELLLNRGWGKPGNQLAHLQSGAQGLLDKKISLLEGMTSDELRKRRDELRAIEAVQAAGSAPLRELPPVQEEADTAGDVIDDDESDVADEQENGELPDEPPEPGAA